MDTTGPVKRRLTAILAADAVGYSARMSENEERAVKTLQGHRRLIDSLIGDYGGRIVGTAGDSVLAEFASSVEAVRCAVEIQEALATRNDSLPEAERMQFRIGVNLGDVIVDGSDILGDGVNVASRLESIADPGGICIASSVFDQISGKLNLGFEDIGERSLKNIGRPVRAYRLAGAAAQRKAPRSPRFAIAAGASAAALAMVALIAFYAGATRDERDESVPPAAVQAAPSPQPAARPETTQPAPSAPADVPPRAAETPPPALPKSSAQVPSRSAAPAAATPVEPASTVAAAPLPAASDQPPAASYTTGMAQGRCERPDGKPGPLVRGPVQVIDGEIVIAVGTPEQPGRVDLRGRPDSEGTLVLNGFIIPGAGRGRGTKVAARYEGNLTNGRAMLAGTQGALRCTLSLMLK